MFVIFAAGALAGSGMSLAMAASPGTVSVGASGGIMAMLVALFIISFRMPSWRAKTQIQIQAARVVIPSMIPVAHGAAALHVDYGAHFGGVLLGGVLGVLLLLSWGERSPLPGYRVSAAVLAGVMMLAFATAALAVAQWYPGFAVVAAMR
jgi:rhomboid protease GluP